MTGQPQYPPPSPVNLQPEPAKGAALPNGVTHDQVYATPAPEYVYIPDEQLAYASYCQGYPYLGAMMQSGAMGAQAGAYYQQGGAQAQQPYPQHMYAQQPGQQFAVQPMVQPVQSVQQPMLQQPYAQQPSAVNVQPGAQLQQPGVVGAQPLQQSYGQQPVQQANAQSHQPYVQQPLQQVPPQAQQQPYAQPLQPQVPPMQYQQYPQPGAVGMQAGVQYQQYQQGAVGQEVLGQASLQQALPNKFGLFLALSILSLVFCGCVFAIPALIYAIKMNTAFKQGDEALYAKRRKACTIWLVVAFLLGLIMNIAYIVYLTDNPAGLF